ncbi:aminotransferase class V-fold PLP-dependent enzyme [bacterium]|nr:aminotransferase class V-fold PLP-dependent enzyme [bacterium]
MMHIPLFKTYISWRSVWNVSTLLIKSNYGTYLGEGPQVKALEQEFGQMFGVKNVSVLNSGTSALELSYELAGIGPGDEVISPVLTFSGTNSCLVHRGAHIVFADTDRDLNVDIEDVKRKITPKTKAIVFVHFGGNNRGLKELLEIGAQKNIIIIEDAAQAIGSDFWGQADFTCLSFQAIKTFTTGDGGALLCKDDEHDKKGRRLRWFGYDREKKQKEGDTDLVEAGYKYHMNDITAAIGRGNLISLPKMIAHRKTLMEEYRRQGIPASIWFAHYLSPRRKELMAFLKESGIHTGIHHYRNDAYTLFGGRKPFKIMDEIENQYLLLPLHHGMNVNDVRRICSLIKSFHEIH